MTQAPQPDAPRDVGTRRLVLRPAWTAGAALLMCAVAMLRVVAAIADSDILGTFGQPVSTTDRLVFVGDAGGGSELALAVAVALVVGGLVLGARAGLTRAERVALLVVCAVAAGFAVLDGATALSSLLDEERNPVQRYYTWSRRAGHSLGFVVNVAISAAALALTRRLTGRADTSPAPLAGGST